MKVNFWRRLCVLAMAVIMAIGMALPTFAAEERNPNGEAEVNAEEITITPYNTSVKMTVAAWDGGAIGYVTLSSYVGLNKTFRIVTSSSSDQGVLTARLVRDSDGKVMSNDWYVSPNGNASWSFFLPSAGLYYLEVDALTTGADVYVTAYWE